MNGPDPSRPPPPRPSPVQGGRDVTGRRALARFWPLAVPAAGLALFFALGLNRHACFSVLGNNREWLLAEVARLGFWAPAAFAAMYAVAAAFALPGGTLLTLAGGFLFGTLWGGLAALAGATLGATVVFLAARTAFGDALRRRAGPGMRRLEDGLRENAMSYLLVLRLVPLFPFWLVNLAPAFFGVRLRTYVLATTIGIVPGTFVFAWVGSGLGAVFAAGGEPDLAIVFAPEVLGPLLALAALALVPVAWRCFTARRRRGAGDLD
ncbi:MAG: TVP38/TMEM64 family protein [Alphaproteobacteria bacterium]|nr:TVP38/TMEM64 family protein [Alphaproteobacteria bacterium]